MLLNGKKVSVINVKKSESRVTNIGPKQQVSFNVGWEQIFKFDLIVVFFRYSLAGSFRERKERRNLVKKQNYLLTFT